MKYFPILEELVSSDSGIFLLMGLVLSAVVGVNWKSIRKNRIGITVSVLIYAACEALSNFCSQYWTGLLLLFVGTVALGTFAGFLIGAIVCRVRNKALMPSL